MVKVYKFATINEINLFCSGAIFGIDVSKWGQNIATGGGGKDIAPVLVGHTLIFSGPGPTGTVTFTAGTDPQGRLTLAQIKSQVQATIPTLLVSTFAGKLVFSEVTPTNGVTLAAAGTANSALGFDSGNATVGKFLSTPFGATPTTPYVMFGYDDNSGMHVLYTWE
jgi:hypothetical protein